MKSPVISQEAWLFPPACRRPQGLRLCGVFRILRNSKDFQINKPFGWLNSAEMKKKEKKQIKKLFLF
jgi:hypothetical protein